MAPNFDDVSEDSLYSGGSGPQLNKALLQITEPEVVVLNENIGKIIIYPIYSVEKVPKSLVDFLHSELNDEIERGDTYPFYNKLTRQEFINYWFGSFAAIMLKHDTKLYDSGNNVNWSSEYLGTYYVKPNYTGRCSHVCNGGFLVNPIYRGQRIGLNLGKSYLKWAPTLGYTYSVFNLVFKTNTASIRLWERLGFEQVGTLRKAAVLKGHSEPVDAFIYAKDL